MTAQAGVVYLVGAGPGDPGLITVRGAECLRTADTVVYDRLSNAALLAHVPEQAECIFMGKEPDTPGAFQDAITQTLIGAARAGKTVVRLKGGDPFVFGRGGEEAQALRDAAVPFEVVPGVTSAIAVPAYAGIPVTHRDLASAFTVVTGSEAPGSEDPQLDWTALATVPGTLVVLMAWRSLDRLVEALLAGGRSADTPAAVIQWGTLPRQRTVTGTLGDIVTRSRQAGITAPVVTIIGPVVALRSELRWFDARPLWGRRVLITRAQTQAGALAKRLAACGAEAVELPTIAVLPLHDHAELDAALSQLPRFDWVVFVSVNAVEAVFRRLGESGRDARCFGGVRIAAIGPATASALCERGIVADYVPDSYDMAAVAAGFSARRVEGAAMLLPRSSLGRENDFGEAPLPHALRAQGAQVTEVTAYHTVQPAERAAEARALLDGGDIDAVTFASSSAVRGLSALLDHDLRPLHKTVVVSIGPSTSQALRAQGVRVDVEATEHTLAGIVTGLVQHFTAGGSRQPAASAPDVHGRRR